MARATTQGGSGGDLTERVIGLEHGLESLARRIGDKLDDGAERFAIIKRQLEQLEQSTRPRPVDRWKAAALVVTVLLVIVGWIWQAAKYPDRAEYGSLATKVETAEAATRVRLDQLREAHIKTQTDVLLMQRRLDSIEAALQKLDDRRPRGRR